MKDIIAQGLLDTIFGMGVVFVLLIFIMIIIWSLKFLNIFDRSFKKESKDSVDEVTRTSSQTNMRANDEIEDEEELIAVIHAAIQASIEDEQDSVVAATAAIMASMEESKPADGLIVRTIRKKNKANWLRG